MSRDPAKTPGMSWALQGCLVGAVALFVLLLLVLLFLGYRQFRENTGVLGAGTVGPGLSLEASCFAHHG